MSGNCPGKQQDYLRNLIIKIMICIRCKKDKPITQFSIGNGGARRSRCKECSNGYYNAWAALNKDKIKDINKLKRIKAEYGLSPSIVEQIWNEQNRQCAICKEYIELWSKNTHIDHNHETGRVRGLLCLSCNTGLGHFKDNPNLLREAAAYLERSFSFLNKKPFSKYGNPSRKYTR